MATTADATLGIAVLLLATVVRCAPQSATPRNVAPAPPIRNNRRREAIFSDIAKFLEYSDKRFKQPVMHMTPSGQLAPMGGDHGAQGAVIFRIDSTTGREVAIKRVSGSLICMAREIETLEVVTRHKVPYCIRLIGVYKVRGREPEVVTVTNLLGYENLHRHIENVNSSTRMDEEHICRNFGKIITVLWYLRRLDIVHRDIKPKNLILDLDGEISVADFGVAKFVHPVTKLTTGRSGSYKIMSPEALAREDYSFSTDLWSAGVVLWMWLEESVDPPFEHYCDRRCDHPRDPREQILRNMRRMNYKVPFTDKTPKEAADLISAILVPADRRITLDQVMRHRWFRTHRVVFTCRSIDNPNASPPIHGMSEPTLMRDRLPPEDDGTSTISSRVSSVLGRLGSRLGSMFGSRSASRSDEDDDGYETEGSPHRQRTVTGRAGSQRRGSQRMGSLRRRLSRRSSNRTPQRKASQRRPSPPPRPQASARRRTTVRQNNRRG